MEYKKLTDLLEFIVDNRGKTVPTSEAGIKLIATNCILNNRLFPVYEKVRYVSKEIYDTWFRSHPKPGDIIFVNKGTPGKVCMVPEPIDFCIAQDMMAFRVDSSKIYNKYLFAVLRSSTIQNQIANSTVGTLIPHYKKEQLKDLMIPVPDSITQKKIGDIYYNLSYKIELNNQINNNLYEQINYIYKETFKDYQTYKRLDEVSNVTIGKTPPRSEQECFTNNKNDIKWISISDLGKSGVFIYDTNEKLKKDAVEKYNIKVIPEDTIILSFKLTVGRVGITTEDMTTNEAIAHFDLYNKKYKNYLYCMLKNYNYNNLGSTSSIATAINSKIVKSMKIGIPYDNDLEKFNNLTFSMFDLIKLNEKNNIYLEQLRDTLLPKLMNGEIDLNNIEI